MLGACLISWRSAFAADASSIEPQDQILRVIPTVRAIRSAGRRRGLVDPQMLSSDAACSRCGTIPRALLTVQRMAFSDREASRICGLRSGNHPRELFRDRPFTAQRMTRHVLPGVFQELTGGPVLVNTSFNARGELIVRTRKMHCVHGND